METKNLISELSTVSQIDQDFIIQVIKDLRWLSNHLEDSLSLGIVFHSTLDMAQSSLSLDSYILSKVSSFDD